MKKIKKILRIIIPTGRSVIEKLLRNELTDCKNVLDLGCGEKSPLRFVKDDKDLANLHSVGVDIFTPYILKNMNESKIHTEYLNMNIFDIDFPDKSFDCALLFDVIEHFDSKDFYNFLPKLERIAKKIIIITPNGFIEQDEYDMNPYQIHKSGWTVDDFEKMGFVCFGMSGSKKIYSMNIKPNLLKIFITGVSQLFVYNKPRKSFHIIAIKRT